VFRIELILGKSWCGRCNRLWLKGWTTPIPWWGLAASRMTTTEWLFKLLAFA